MSSHTYTTIAEMRRLFTQFGVDLLVDDDEDGSVSVAEQESVDDAIAHATEELDIVLAMFHEPADLANSRLVRRWATVLACHYLSQRGGNAAKFNKLVERIDGLLNEIAGGTRQLAVPLRANFSPSVRNYVVDDRFRGRKIRVRETSTGDHYPGEDVDIALWEYEP